MTQERLDSILDAAQAKYWAALYRAAEKVRAEVVIPICLERSWRFLAGNGTFAFITLDTDEIVPDYGPIMEDDEYRKVIYLLNTPADGQTIGSLINDYQPSPKR